jgi:hypothetical protein
VASHYTAQPTTQYWDRLVPTAFQFVFDLHERHPHPFGDRDTLELETSVPARPADKRKPQKIERLRLTLTTVGAVVGGEPPELDQPRLIRVQLQPKLRHTPTKIDKEPLRIRPVLEAADKIIREAHDDHLTASVMPPPPIGPQIKNVVQVHISQQRRNYAPNAMGNFEFDVTLSYRRLERPRRATD